MSKITTRMAKPQIFLTRDDFPSIARELLEKKFDLECWKASEGPIPKEKLLQKVQGKFALYCTPHLKIDHELLDAAGPSLKVIATNSVGTDHLDVDEIKTRGIKIGYTPGVLTESVAEMAVLLALTVGRKLLEANAAVRAGNCIWTPTWMCGVGFDNAVLGILGCGRIGISLAKKLKPFSPRIILYTSRRNKPEVDDLGGQLTSVDDVVSQSDFIFITAALTPETIGLLSRERIAKMKSEAIVVNVARGPLIDQQALLEALQDNKIGGAGLDVTVPEPLPPCHPLLAHHTCVVTPHVASATFRTRNAMAEISARNIIAVHEGTPMPAEL